MTSTRKGKLTDATYGRGLDRIYRRLILGAADVTA